MSNLLDFAKEELARIGGQEDEMQQEMNKGILEIVEKFSEQGHSGFSAQYALSQLRRLLDYKPICPLTGEDEEWTEVFEGQFQNNRCYSVFKDKTGVYNSEGKVFSVDNGESWYTSFESRVPVTFPYIVPEEPERIILKNRKD